MSLGTNKWGFAFTPMRIRDLARDKASNVSLFQKSPDWVWGLHSRVLNGRRVSFPGIKRPGHEVNHLTPSTA